MSTQEGESSRSSSKSESKTSSTTSLTQLIEKLDGSMATGQSNYNAWRFRIIRILKEKNLLSAIEDTEVSASKDDQAFTIITLNIKDSQIPHIQDTTTAKQAWAALREVHQGIGTNGRMVFMQRLWALKMTEGQDMAQHLNQFRELANQLRGLSAEGKEINNSELLTILTLSLPESYEALVMALQSLTDVITFDIMAGRLLQESAQRHVGEVTRKGHDHTLGGSQTAFSANRPASNTRSRPGRGDFHIYGRGRGGFRGGSRGFNAGGVGGQRLRPNSGSGTIQPPSATKCHYCGKDGHWKKECYKRKSDEAGNQNTGGSQEFTFVAEDPPPAARMGWIIDSGASQHLCGNRNDFITYTNISKVQEITIADGTKIKAKGVGAIEIVTEVTSITLTNVWHVHDIGGNLMSVSRMVDAGYTVEFGKSTCSVCKAGVRTLLRRRLGSLYYLKNGSATKDEQEQIEANLGLITNQSPLASIDIWHRRLCHRTLDETPIRYITSKVTNMEVSDKAEKGHTVCGICAMGRQHKEAGTKTREKATEILAEVHSDICGPMQTTGLNGE